MKSRAEAARIFELLLVNRVLAVCLVSGVSVAVFSAHCSTLTLNPHGQIAAIVCICLLSLTLSLFKLQTMRGIQALTLLHTPVQIHTLNFATGHGHTAGKPF